jgi:hypothetical protein
MEPRWIALLICLLIPAGLAGATAWVQWRYWRIRSWKQATGRIDSARSVPREVRSKRFRTLGSGSSTEFVTDESIRTDNLAEISYSFAIGPNTYHGNRVSLGKDPGSAEVVALLKRYPPGKVVKVFYDPDNPSECILEGDDGGNIGNAWRAVAALTAWILAGFVVITEGAEWLHSVIAEPGRVPVVIALTLFSLAMILFSGMSTKKARAMRKWPTIAGRIVRSEVTTTVQQHDRPNMARDYRVTMYVPRVVYAYEVDGNSFEGDDVGWTVSGNTPSAAEKTVRRFPLSSQVQVSYDPDDPTQSTIAPPGATLPMILWLIAALLAFAAYAIGWL